MAPASDRVQLLYRNALQMKTIVQATYTGQDFDSLANGCSENGLSEGQKLACLWQRALTGTGKDDTKPLYEVRHTAIFPFSNRSFTNNQ